MSSLSIKNLKLDINGNKILHDINLELDSGEFIMLLGSNGCGKSSLLKTIYRENPLTSGSIILNGKDINKYRSKEFFNHVALLNQNYNQMLFNDLSIIENYRIFSQHNNKSDEKIFIEHLKKYNARFVQMDNLSDTKVSLLSGGQKQTLALVLLISRKPALILLDEHTSALDQNAEAQLMALTHTIIQEHKISCIMITHNLELATQYSDRTVILKNGTISAILAKNHYNKLTFLEHF